VLPQRSSSRRRAHDDGESGEPDVKNTWTWEFGGEQRSKGKGKLPLVSSQGKNKEKLAKALAWNRAAFNKKPRAEEVGDYDQESDRREWQSRPQSQKRRPPCVVTREPWRGSRKSGNKKKNRGMWRK